jgi:hypothetical protein
MVETTTDKSLPSFHSSTTRISPSSISTLTIVIADPTLAKTEMTTYQKIKPTTISEITSTTIEEISHSLTNTSSLTTTTTQMMKPMEKASSRTSIKTTVESETILSSIMRTITPIPRSSIVYVAIENQSIPSSTSTKPLKEAHHMLLYILFSLLFVIICITITVLIACLFYWHRKRSQRIAENSNTVSETTIAISYSNVNNDINKSESLSNTSSSLLSTQYNETGVSNKSNLNFEHMFNDKTF